MDKLLRITGFMPYLLIAFLNAFVDLGHKIVIQNSVFKIYDGEIQIMLTAVVNGLILLPALMLYTPAGYISDRYRKPAVMRLSAAVAVILTLMITACYYLGWFEIAFAMTFMLAVQSAFYSPAKYGYIKELTGKSQLASANGAIQAVTIAAILAGVFIFSWLFELGLQGVSYESGSDILRQVASVGWLLVACSLFELWLTFRLPIRREPDQTGFDWKRYGKGQYLRNNLQAIAEHRGIRLSIVGLALFWGISQVVLAAFPAFAKEMLAETNTVVIQGILACSGIGIALGSILAAWASRRHIETGLIPLGALGVVAGVALIPVLESSLALALDFIFLGMSGGLFIVPLNALIQFHAPEGRMGTVLAGNNWVHNLVMISFLGLTVFFSYQGSDSVTLFRLLTLVALVGTLYTVFQLPHSLVRFTVARLFAGRYRILIEGFENLPAEGGVLMLGNHISWLDWAILQIASPRQIHFVMHRKYYDRWYLRWILDLAGVIPITKGTSRAALEQINQCLEAGEVVCLFPEGILSRSGQLGEFKRGFERAVEGVEGVILPFYLRGLWGSRFSNASEGLKKPHNRWARREIIVAFGRPMPIDSKAHEVKQRVFDLSITTWQRYTQSLKPIAHAWIDRVKQHGSQLCLADASGGMELNGYRALTAAIAFSRLIGKRSPEQNIGLLLPTSSGGIIANMAVLLLGKTLINLNYTANLSALKGAVEKAELRTVYTSRRFMKKLAQRGIDLQPLLEQVQVHYLEDLKEEIGTLSKLAILGAVRLLPAWVIRALFSRKVDPEQVAAILFSSGSEGSPKGVMLSHRNIMANIRQVSDVLDTRLDDRVVASLPLFHAFGLSVTGLMPLIEGMPAITHPDPTDVVTIAKAVARHKATVMCATSTFLRLFNRNHKVHPLMLDSLRVVVAGAEKLQPEIRDAFALKFNKPIYEGYGATETTPVASVNLPDRLHPNELQAVLGNKPGTVGLPLPGGSFRVVDPDSLEPLPKGEDGLILFGGAQVMLGYLDDPQKTAEVIVEQDGVRWYKTGDKGHLDEDGFLTIVDRYSRFAKIGGEMVSLGAVESAIARQLPEDIEVLATTLPDEKKGEQVVLLYSGEVKNKQLDEQIRASGLHPLMLPAKLIKVPQIPKLGSGKNDFTMAKTIAMEASA
ncbi:MAG: acyl-[ACP]--phospholipid O-acyltransferase [Candidatus Thiodiazotropha sp. (ex Monitilora ramsayi)]|nr:acyl-[ACP]--phospholipid O-acyltransferase [Candidatus Thiodiazotropha sp. (ex Monitilora ramsayi)]